MTWYARIKPTSPRFSVWMDVYRTELVQLTGPERTAGSGPDGPGEFYHGDVAALTTEQRQRLVRFLAVRFKLDGADVERDLDDPQHGMPIKADDVTILSAAVDWAEDRNAR